jgi:hypothetical protein
MEMRKTEITCIGSDEAIAALGKAAQALKGGGVKWDAEKRRFSTEAEEPEKQFKKLMDDFPEIAFAFDADFNVDVSSGDGDGRYFAVFEKGKVVYDAGNFDTCNDFIKRWLDRMGYDEGDEPFENLARWKREQNGEDPDGESEDDRDIGWDIFNDEVYGEYKASYCAMSNDAGYYESIDEVKELEAEGELYGIKDYLNKKEAGELPCYHAEGFKFRLWSYLTVAPRKTKKGGKK